MGGPRSPVIMEWPYKPPTYRVFFSEHAVTKSKCFSFSPQMPTFVQEIRPPNGITGG